MSKHTELPWHYFRGALDKSAGVESEDKSMLLYMDGISLDAEKSNAEFIVKACNNHYQLLQAAQVGLFAISFCEENLGEGNGYELIGKLRQAIKDASQ